MSKKNKKFKAKLSQAMQQLNNHKPSSTASSNQPQKSVVSLKQEKTDTQIIDTLEVRKDIKRIVFALSVCIVILVAFWLLDLKTTYLNNFINSLTRFLHLA